MQDLGAEFRVRTNTDSSAALGIAKDEDWVILNFK